MPAEELVDVMEEETDAAPVTPEVEVQGDEAVIRLHKPEGLEERKVKLPQTTWG